MNFPFQNIKIDTIAFNLALAAYHFGKWYLCSFYGFILIIFLNNVHEHLPKDRYLDETKQDLIQLRTTTPNFLKMVYVFNYHLEHHLFPDYHNLPNMPSLKK